MSNNNDNEDDNKYQSKIDKLMSNEKLTKDNVLSFHTRTNEKVKTIVRTATKLLELQVSLSRCCEWLNELVDKNRVTSQDPDIDPECISKIEGLLDEGVFLGDIFDRKLQSIQTCVENMEPLWETLENARLIIHSSIVGMPKVDVTQLSQRAKDYEIKTNEYSSKKRSKTTKTKKNSPKQPINEDDDVQNNNNNNKSNNSSSIINVENSNSNSNDNDDIDIDTHQSHGERVSTDNKENRKRSAEQLDYTNFLKNSKESKKMRKLDNDNEEEASDDDNQEYVEDTNMSVSIQKNSPNTSQNTDSVIDLT